MNEDIEKIIDFEIELAKVSGLFFGFSDFFLIFENHD